MIFWGSDDDADYVQRIKVLAPDKPLPLPPIKPLKAEYAGVPKKLARFTDRLAKKG